MRKLIFIVAVCVLTIPIVAAATVADVVQAKVDTQWKCGVPTAHMLPIADQPNHAYGVEQLNCTATKGEMGGVKEKDGVATEFIEATGDSSKGHGIFIATLANGDRVNYSYTFSGKGKNNMLVSGSNSWTITGGTGKFKGATGKGTCSGKGNADGTAVFDCTGSYTIK